MKTPPANIIESTDSFRRERLLELADLVTGNHHRRIDLRWPDRDTLQRSALNDWNNDGPRTVLSLSGQLAAHSAILRAGASTVTLDRFEDAVMPVLNRELLAAWGTNAADIGTEPLLVADAAPRRLSAFVTVSDQLRHQSPLLVGQFIEAQLLSAIAAAIDKAALVGDGGQEPLGILNDDGILTHERTAANVDSLLDLAAMESAITDDHGEADPGAFVWITDASTRKTLRTTEGIGGPIWGNAGGPLGHRGIASPFAPPATVILAQAPKLVVVDWGKLQIENLTEVPQAKAGFRTLLVSGFFDFLVSEPSAVCIAVNPEIEE